jgi:hypothetical protein
LDFPRPRAQDADRNLRPDHQKKPPATLR